MAKGERRAANLTAEQIDRVQVLRGQGLGPTLIARRMQVGVTSVYRALERGVGPKAGASVAAEVHRVAVIGSREAFREFVTAKRKPGAVLMRHEDILKLDDDQEFVHVSRMERVSGLVFQQMTVLYGADPELVVLMAKRVAAALA